VGGGDYIEAVTAKYGTTVTLPTTATREGYTFAGWYKDPEYTQSAGTSITLEDNTTLYAIFRKDKFNVNFDTNGHGTTPTTQVINR
jgi:uncharacterized repeat protein (TIGR02543 family)